MARTEAPADPVSAAVLAPGYRLAPSERDEAETIRRYAPMVKRLAGHVKGRLPDPVQRDDLMQAGLIAVLRITRQGGTAQLGAPALRRAILNAMIDEARRETWAPVRTVRLAQAAARAMQAVKGRTGREAGDEEVAAEMGIPLAEYRRALVDIAGLRLLPLDDVEDCGEGLRAADDQETSLSRRRMMTALAEAIAALPERERLMVSLYYEHELNMEEVGQVLGLNKSTVCRAHGRALLRLKSALDAWSAERAGSLPAAGE